MTTPRLTTPVPGLLLLAALCGLVVCDHLPRGATRAAEAAAVANAQIDATMAAAAVAGTTIELVRIAGKESQGPEPSPAESAELAMATAGAGCLEAYWADMRSREGAPFADGEAEALTLALTAAARRHGVAPSLLAAVAWRESRACHDTIGDGGRACGCWQRHARYEVPRELSNDTEAVAAECWRLRWDTGYAANVAARMLATMDNVCHYNQGRTCRPQEYEQDCPWDDCYGTRVRVTQGRIEQACPMLVD